MNVFQKTTIESNYQTNSTILVWFFSEGNVLSDEYSPERPQKLSSWSTTWLMNCNVKIIEWCRSHGNVTQGCTSIAFIIDVIPSDDVPGCHCNIWLTCLIMNKHNYIGCIGFIFKYVFSVIWFVVYIFLNDPTFLILFYTLPGNDQRHHTHDIHHTNRLDLYKVNDDHNLIIKVIYCLY